MALKIKLTSDYVPRPRALIYGDPGDGKTSLCATCCTQGQKDILFAVTEGGIQSIAHRSVPYVEIRKVEDWDDLVGYFRSGKAEGEGMIRVGNNLYRGVCVDLFSEFVQMNLMDMTAKADTVVQGTRSKDDPSEYEYKKLNFRIIRQIRELRNLPLQYVLFTAHAQEWKDKMGNTTKVQPAFVGTKIVTSVNGAMDYVFRVYPPANAKEASKYRLIRTQPTQVHYAKARVPGVAGNIPLPSEIKYPLGHETMLPAIFKKVSDIISGQRKLEPTVPIPTDVEEPTEGNEAA